MTPLSPSDPVVRGHAILLSAVLRNSDASRMHYVISEHDLGGIPPHKNILVTVEYIDEGETVHVLKEKS